MLLKKKKKCLGLSGSTENTHIQRVSEVAFGEDERAGDTAHVHGLPPLQGRGAPSAASSSSETNRSFKPE